MRGKSIFSAVKCGGGIRTCDLLVMSLTSYLTAPSRVIFVGYNMAGNPRQPYIQTEKGPHIVGGASSDSSNRPVTRMMRNDTNIDNAHSHVI